MIKIDLPETLESNNKPSYCLTVFKDRLLAVQVYPDFSTCQYYFKVFSFLSRPAVWQEIYSDVLDHIDQDLLSSFEEDLTAKLSSPNELEEQDKSIAEIFIQSVSLFRPSDGTECLYISVITPITKHVLWTDNGELFHLDAGVPEEVISLLENQKLIAYRNSFDTFLISSEGLGEEVNYKLHQSRNVAPWQTLTALNCGEIDCQNISSFAVFNNYLYIAVLNLEKGFQILKARIGEVDSSFNWQPVLENGAHRHILNQTISRMLLFQGNLYLASGLNIDRSKEQKNEFYPAGFELIRIYPDDDWDIIVGTPRFTKDGLKVPLSAKGPGFDDAYLSRVECLAVHDDNLYLATENLDTLQIWRSQDGEEWEALALHDELRRYRDLESFKILSTSSGMTLVISSYEASSSQKSEIWMDASGQ